MNKICTVMLVTFLSIFSGCNSDTEDSTRTGKEVLAPQPVRLRGNNVFTLQNGSVECFQDTAGNKELDIVCHAYSKTEDGSRAASNSLSKDTIVSWMPPELDKQIGVTSFTCSSVHGGLGYRCNLVSDNVISQEDVALQIRFALLVHDNLTKEAVTYEDTLKLADQNNRIPLEVDTVLIEDSLDSLKPVGLSVDLPRSVVKAMPLRVINDDVSFVDSSGELLREKIKLACKQVASLQDESSETVSFQVRCDLLISSEAKNSILNSTYKIEGNSYLDGVGYKGLDCSSDVSGYSCRGNYYKENLSLSENQNVLAKIELKISATDKYTLLSQTIALVLQDNPPQ